MKISDIRIGDRSRKELGDISSLARSIEEVGLLHPVVVSRDGMLIAGARRIAAFTLLGRDEIPHTIADSLQDAIALLRAERDENTERKDFLRSEAVAMAERLEPLEKKAAKERQGERTDKHPEKFTGSSKGTATDRVAAAVGMSRPTLTRAQAVVEAARSDPERYGPVAEQMDRTGNVHGAYKALADQSENPRKRITLTRNKRVEKIRAMSAKGHTAAQIANEIGTSRETVVRLAKEAEIELPDSLMGNVRKMDVNRIISETVSAAESLAIGLDLIDSKLDEVDVSKIDEWISSLRGSTSAINRLIRILERINTHGNK